MIKKTKQRHRQIIEIEALQNKIERYAREINRPFSILISITLVPTLLMLLLLDPRSPFYSIYQTYYKNQFQTCHKNAEEIMDFYQLAPQTLENILKKIEDDIKSFCQSTRELLSNECSTDTVLQYMDNNPDGDFTVDDANRFKQSLIRIIHYYLKLSGENKLHSKNNNVLQAFTIKKLYHLAIKIRDKFAQNLPTVVSMSERIFTDSCVKVNFYQLMVLPKIFLTVLAQQFIVDRALLHFFPQGLGFYSCHLKNITIPRDLSFLDQTTSNELTKELQKQCDFLAIKARRNIRISRTLLPILFGLCLAYSGSEVSPHLWILLICMLSSAMTGCWNEANNLYKNARYHHKLSQAENTIKLLFLDYYSHIIILDYGSLETSQIEITLMKMKDLTLKYLHQNIMAVLIANNIAISHVTRQHIVIPATLNLSPYKIDKIRNDIKLALSRQVMLNTLNQQLAELRKTNLIEIHLVPLFTQGFLKTQEITIKAPKILKNQITDTFLHLQPTASDFSSAILIISMNGYQKSDDDKLTMLIKAIQDFSKTLHQPEIYFETDDGDIYKQCHHAPKNKKSSKFTASNSAGMPIQKSDLSIQWPSGCYQSRDENNPISPIENTSFFRHQHFTLFRSDKKDFPDEKAYEKFKKIIGENPKIVSAHGAQGLKFSAEMRRRKGIGTWFPASLKAKAIGAYGNIRVLAHKEISPTGETLHVFDTVVSKAH